MKEAGIVIREAKRSDAEEIGGMAKDFAVYLRALGDKTNFRFNARTYLRDGFGANPAFKGFIAEANKVVAGYLLYHGGYDTDRAVRTLYIADLYVRPEYRRQGVGKALMQTALEICQETGGKRIVWTVYTRNRNARRFYWHIGARYIQDMLMMKLPTK